ncbi:MAG: arginase [Flavobacteriales bacterium]|nr:arginase [Flavobacteriales bacterium]|tara:strand:- start:1556 stop:2725 length:1170 start_codon:yes stop_codon:yes gene_type:complete
MFSNYFSPVSQDVLDFKETLNQNQVGFNINCYSGAEFPDINNIDIALIVVPENRGSVNHSESSAYSAFRKSFYNLFEGNWKLRISDFGNLKAGDNLKDTYFALNDIISHLLSQSVFPLVLGGSQDLVYPIYQAYESFTKGVNLLCVDSRFDLIDLDGLNINSRNFIGYIIKQEANHLTNFINLGFQSYLCQNDESHLLEKMLFESCRLGDLRENIKESEPYLRSADIVSFDLSAIKQADAPGTSFPSPNGLEAHHACVISRYAGMSDRVSSFGLFEFASLKDVTNQTANLISQIIWYFFEGFSLRINDYPSSKTIDVNYQKYLIPVKNSNLQFVFYKSKNTGRWWVSSCMEFDKETNYKETVIPCSYEDYLNTISGDIPKRIYKILKTT